MHTAHATLARGCPNPHQPQDTCSACGHSVPPHSQLKGCAGAQGTHPEWGSLPNMSLAVHRRMLCSSNCQALTWAPAPGRGRLPEGRGCQALTLDPSHIGSVPSETQPSPVLVEAGWTVVSRRRCHIPE